MHVFAFDVYPITDRQFAGPVYSVQSKDELYAVAPGKIVGATGANGALVRDELAAAGALLLSIPNTGEFTMLDINRTVEIAIDESRVAFVFMFSRKNQVR